MYFSSRFTQSEKYSESFEGCFKISDFDIRTGDICNACVLIVKRWKKLPLNSTKDWAHVVDARYDWVSKLIKFVNEIHQVLAKVMLLINHTRPITGISIDQNQSELFIKCSLSISFYQIPLSDTFCQVHFFGGYNCLMQ